MCQRDWQMSWIVWSSHVVISIGRKLIIMLIITHLAIRIVLAKRCIYTASLHYGTYVALLKLFNSVHIFSTNWKGINLSDPNSGRPTMFIFAPLWLSKYTLPKSVLQGCNSLSSTKKVVKCTAQIETTINYTISEQKFSVSIWYTRWELWPAFCISL